MIPFFLPVFWAFFIGSSLKAIVFRVFAMLGIGLVTYTGSTLVLDAMVGYWLDYAYDLPPRWLSFLGFLYADKAFSLIVSAGAASLTIKTAKSFIGRRTRT
jgi:hypothetical protein